MDSTFEDDIFDLWLCVANYCFAGHRACNNVARLVLLNLPPSLSNWMSLILKAPHLRRHFGEPQSQKLHFVLAVPSTHGPGRAYNQPRALIWANCVGWCNWQTGLCPGRNPDFELALRNDVVGVVE
jgi:hypothetical protein